MNPAGQTICLSMIVKNEARVIRRCLDSVRDIIDYWVIVDTGSTDGTQDIIRAHFQDVPGELVERPWRDFAQNRSEALALARPRGDYTFIIDADDALELQAGFQLPRLSADSYQIDIQDTNIRYQRTQFVSNALAWRYAGVLHEYLTCEGAGPTGTLPLTMRRNHAGARRRDPSTYLNDVAVLEAELGREADPFLISRYTFYLAQSYRDSNQPERALEAYLKRADLGYWHEETCVALLQAARLMQTLERPAEDVLAIYSRARQACPDRAAEALHGAARYCRLGDRFEEGYQYALAGLNLARPGGGLFVETWIYDYGLLDELAVCAYWTGRYAASLEANEKVLALDCLPQDQRARIVANADFSRERLKPPPAALGRPLKVAIYTIALNEAAHVDRWCQSTEGADFRIVADTGSADGTKDLLRGRGVTVHSISVQPWRFDDARNAALALVPAGADICISLDMDEFMLPGWRDAVEAAWVPGGAARLFYRVARGIRADGQPETVFRRGKIHSRGSYRWRRGVHEDLHCVGPDERVIDIEAVLMGEIQDTGKDRGQYLPMMERAHAEDPADAQLCFWLARELMAYGEGGRAVEKFLHYLGLGHWTFAEERAEAMRFLARVQGDAGWLHRAVVEAGHRREVWLDLAEHFHGQSDWPGLLWATSGGLERARLTGTYLDDPAAWGPRLSDLAALARARLGFPVGTGST